VPITKRTADERTGKMCREMERFAVKRSKRGATVVFIVVDTLKGTIAKTAITDKARAERIARRLNERVEEPCNES
jgi:hypothetical protein